MSGNAPGGQAQQASTNGWTDGWTQAGKGANPNALYPGQQGYSSRQFPTVNPHTGTALTGANWGNTQQASPNIYNPGAGFNGAALGRDIQAIQTGAAPGMAFPAGSPAVSSNPNMSRTGPVLPGWGYGQQGNMLSALVGQAGLLGGSTPAASSDPMLQVIAQQGMPQATAPAQQPGNPFGVNYANVNIPNLNPGNPYGNYQPFAMGLGALNNPYLMYNLLNAFYRR